MKDHPVHIPGLGEVAEDDRLGWLLSGPVPLGLLGGRECRIALSGYEEDDAQEQYHAAIAHLRAASHAVLQAAEHHVFQYYLDTMADWGESDPACERIDAPADVWRHVQFGEFAMVERRGYGDRGIYVSIECECNWEPEHGLQIVLKNGSVVTKVGPFDGHLSNADSYADDSLESVIYR